MEHELHPRLRIWRIPPEHFEYEIVLVDGDKRINLSEDERNELLLRAIVFPGPEIRLFVDWNNTISVR